MDELTFSKLLKGQLFKEELKLTPRKSQREAISVEVMVASKSQTFKAKLIDCSPTVMRIDKNISIAVNEPCTVVLKTNPPIELMCFPMIGENEFREGVWNRLRIKSVSFFSKIQSMVKKTA